MKHLSKIAVTAAFIFFFVTACVCVGPVTQAHAKAITNPALILNILGQAGIAAEAVQLQRGDGFSRGFAVVGPRGEDIVIGLAEDLGGPVLIAVNGYESIIGVSEDGSLSIAQEDGFPIDLEELVCIISAVISGLNAIELCETDLCTALTIITLIIDIFQCLNAE